MPSAFSISSSCFLSKFSLCLLRWKKELDNTAFNLRGTPGVSLCLFPLPPSSSPSKPQHHGSHLARANALSQTSPTLLQSHTRDGESISRRRGVGHHQVQQVPKKSIKLRNTGGKKKRLIQHRHLCMPQPPCLSPFFPAREVFAPAPALAPEGLSEASHSPMVVMTVMAK